MALKMVQELAANRSLAQERATLWWATTSPAGLNNGRARELIAKGGTDLPHAAQILADMHAAIADSSIAVWDAKYTWWTSRPITEAPDLTTVVPTPPYPAYPLGYWGVMGAGTTVIGHYFPDAADELADRAWEAAASRAWADIDYVIDDDAGLAMGRQVGRLVCALPGANPVDRAYGTAPIARRGTALQSTCPRLRWPPRRGPASDDRPHAARSQRRGRSPTPSHDERSGPCQPDHRRPGADGRELASAEHPAGIIETPPRMRTTTLVRKTGGFARPFCAKQVRRSGPRCWRRVRRRTADLRR